MCILLFFFCFICLVMIFVFCFFRMCSIFLVIELEILWKNNVGSVISRFRMVVINVWEILFVINFGLSVLNRVMDWKVMIILIIVFSSLRRGVVIVMIFNNGMKCFKCGFFLMMVFVSFSFRVFGFSLGLFW